MVIFLIGIFIQEIARLNYLSKLKNLQKNIIFNLIVTVQPNLNLPWDASNLNQHFVTTHPTLFLNNMSALRHFFKYFFKVLWKGNEF